MFWGSLYILDKLATLYLCKYTKCELLAIILRKTIDLLASLCYNKIKEREGKPKGNPREQNGGKDYGTG